MILVKSFFETSYLDMGHPSTRHPSTELYPPPIPPYPRLEPKVTLKTPIYTYREMSDILIYQ